MVRCAPIRMIAVFALVLVAAGGCSLFEGGGGAGGAQTVPTPPAVEAREGTVVLANIAYNPPRLTVPAGREVTWIWDDDGIGHTVTADDGSFDSERRMAGEFKRVFDQPGEYRYHCEIHARMKGTVVVGAS